MSEITIAELHRLMLQVNRNVAETRQEVARLGSRVETVAAEVSAVALLDAKIDILASDLSRLSDEMRAANQLLTGVRSLGKSTYDISTGVARRVRVLIQALIERNVIAYESMQDALLASDPPAESPDVAAAEAPR